MFPVTGSPKCVAFRSKHSGKYLQSAHAGSEERAGGEFFTELSGADNGEVDVLASPFLRPQQAESESGRAAESAEEEAYLHVGSWGGRADEEKSLNEFTILELSQMVLPKYVVFKGDNDLYLSARVIQKYNYLEFAATDIADPTAVNTIFPEHVGGIVRIKSNHFGMFWRRSPNWIWADNTDTTGRNQDTRFRVVQVSDYFALQNLGNLNYCKRLTADRKTSCLNAAVSTITVEARIRVEEAVLERQIDNVNFRLSEARIYGETPLYIPNVTSTNRTSQPNNKTLTMGYQVTDSRSFTSTVGLKIGVEVNFRAGIPIIADGKVGMSTEVSTEQVWGKTTEETKTLEVKYEAIVPSMSRVILTAAATQGFVDVPFSYRQRDVLITGQVVENTLHDGLFTGVNSYNFHYETTEERL